MIKPKNHNHFAFLTKYADPRHYDAREHIMGRINGDGLESKYASHPHFGDEHRDALMKRFADSKGDYNIPYDAFKNGMKPEHQKILDANVGIPTISRASHLLDHISSGKAMDLFNNASNIHKQCIVMQRNDVARHVLDTHDSGTLYKTALMTGEAKDEDYKKGLQSPDLIVSQLSKQLLAKKTRDGNEHQPIPDLI